MITRHLDRRLLSCRGIILALILATWTLGSVIPASAAPAHAGDTLSGTWQVSRACVSGCTGTTILRETVRPSQGSVFMAAGSATMQLDRIGKKKVLVYSPTSSSLLTIRVPGQQMGGPGIGQDGSVYKITWHCVAAPTSQEAASHSPDEGMHTEAVSRARVIC